jgi:hypothetical protein
VKTGRSGEKRDVHYNKAYAEEAKRTHGIDPGDTGDFHGGVYALVDEMALAVVGAVEKEIPEEAGPAAAEAVVETQWCQILHKRP